MTGLLRTRRPEGTALWLLGLAALAVAVGGVEHARLFHRGYAEVKVVGPLFLVNAVASLVCVLLLIFDRALLFVAGAVAISAGSIVAILISHSSSFFGFAESGYDGTAKVIVAAEAAAILLSGAGLVALGRAPRGVVA